MDKFSYLGNSDVNAVESLYEQYLQNPESVDFGWKKFFEGFDFSRANYEDAVGTDQNFQKEWETSCSALINHIKFEQSKNDRTNHRELSKLLNMVQDAQSVPEKLSKIASKEFPGQ